MKFSTLRLCVLLTTLALVSFSCSNSEVGTRTRPFMIFFVPSVDAEQISSGAEKITAHVSKFVSQKLYQKDTGFYVKSSVPTSYIAVVEAFGTNKADFSAFNTFSYILAKDIKKYPIEAVLQTVRGENETSYKGQIIAHKDSPVKKLEDLAGKSFAYTDPASTAGYILPAYLFKEMNIAPKETIFAGKHDSVVMKVYQKDVDAGATFYSPPAEKEINGKKVMEIRDARARVKTQYPDVEDKVKIIGFTPDTPNEPWVIRSNLYKDEQKNALVKKAVVEGILDYISTPEGKASLVALYSVTGLIPADDSKYVEIRKIVQALNVNVEAEVAKTKK